MRHDTGKLSTASCSLKYERKRNAGGEVETKLTFEAARIAKALKVGLVAAWHSATEEKREIVAESLNPDTGAGGVLRKYGISSGQLYTWRRQLTQRLGGHPPEPATSFARVDVSTKPHSSLDVIASLDTARVAHYNSGLCPQDLGGRLSNCSGWGDVANELETLLASCRPRIRAPTGLDVLSARAADRVCRGTRKAQEGQRRSPRPFPRRA
jgi:transposase-like protein